MNNNSLFSHLLSILLLPGVVAGIIPFYVFRYIPEPQIYDDHLILKVSGLVFFGFGLTLFIITVMLFAFKGKGTLAPWSSPRRLVIAGPYRYVRNPMIIGVISMLIGEALFLNCIALLIWAMLFFVINTINFEFIEERRLETRFGESYLDYKEAVPRWIPSLKPYKTD